jgi:hypothetical protein
MRTGTANLPLHYGKAPAWLFARMRALAGQIVEHIVFEFGPEQVLDRLSDPYWFQAFGCVLGFDWHSSGVTTTVCGALKEAVRGREHDLGLFVAGGKGATSRKTPAEIETFGDRHSIAVSPADLVYASRMSAKVDSTALQDGYQLYHHCFFFTASGQWAVVQQGMNEGTRWARRYHWLSTRLSDFVCEPHAAVCTQQRAQQVLNLVAEESDEARRTTALLSQERPERLAGEIRKLQSLDLPRRHELLVRDLRPESVERIMLRSYERQPEDFRALLEVPGVGPKTIRALALVAELVYGVKGSTRDPARYSFAHGGKDGYPYPVDRTTYDRSIEVLREAVAKAKLGERERLDALRRLSAYSR